MAKKYIIRYSGHSVEMSRPNSTVLVYKIPYRDLEVKNYGFQIPNAFIVYILFGKNDQGRDVVYVGKSKNGLTYRPVAHTDKYNNWTACYVVTQFKERTFLNDGTIQYLEDKLNKRINDLKTFVNTTNMTTTGTANKSDEEDCDDFLEEIYPMLFILGLDLLSGNDKDPIAITTTQTSPVSRNESFSAIPDGVYYMDRKLKRNDNQPVDAKMRVENSKFILCIGSKISASIGSGCPESILELRKNTDYVENGILKKEVAFDSPSSAGCFVIGASCNGWVNWKTKDGIHIDIYRGK